MKESPGRRGRVLIVDDEKKWRDILSHTLSEGGFVVATAATKEETLEQLSKGLFHLVVLDIRIPDNSNEEGMQLLRECALLQHRLALAVIVITAFGNQHMREGFRDYGISDFVRKQEFLDTDFLDEVQNLFLHKLNINLGLVLHWQGGLTPSKAVQNLWVDGHRIKGGDNIFRFAEELEDLLCRLFHDAKEVLLRPFGTGMSGTGILWAQPFNDDGGARAVVVKFGDAEEIDREDQNFLKYVQPFLGGGRSPHVQNRRRTQRLGGILYSLLGEDGDRLEDFASFYQRADIPEICKVIDHLFLHTCKAWYANRGQTRILDITQSYLEALDIRTESLERALVDLRSSVQGRDQLHFRSLSGRTFPNPVVTLVRQPIKASTYQSITHGDFNDQNILVDAAGHCWLIDFQSTGPGHILRDIVQLDAVIRVRLLAAEEVSLEERLALEEALNAPETFSQMSALAARQPAGNPAVLKAFAACAQLRALAAQLVASNPIADVSEYYAGLLYCNLNMIRFRSLPTIQREHALLSASLLTERLRI